MGIYIFTKSKLAEYLNADAADPESSNDFGKNIIPNMLKAGERMYAYEFEGYWKDVGTISSLWEANMDLLGQAPTFSLADEKWRIYTRHQVLAPQYIGSEGEIENSIISEGCEIYGTVKNSVLFPGVKVMPGAVVRDSVVMSGTVIGEGTELSYALIDTDVTVGKNCRIGGEVGDSEDIVVLGEGTVIADNEKIEAGVMIPELRKDKK